MYRPQATGPDWRGGEAFLKTSDKEFKSDRGKLSSLSVHFSFSEEYYMNYMIISTDLCELECFCNEVNLHRKVPFLCQMCAYYLIQIPANSTGALIGYLLGSTVTGEFHLLMVLWELHFFFLYLIFEGLAATKMHTVNLLVSILWHTRCK